MLFGNATQAETHCLTNLSEPGVGEALSARHPVPEAAKEVDEGCCCIDDADEKEEGGGDPGIQPLAEVAAARCKHVLQHASIAVLTACCASACLTLKVILLQGSTYC